MSNDVSARALGAAIRVALGTLALTGCGGVVTRDPTPSETQGTAAATPTVDAPKPNEAPAARPSAPGPAAIPPAPSASSTATPADCRAKLHAA